MNSVPKVIWEEFLKCGLPVFQWLFPTWPFCSSDVMAWLPEKCFRFSHKPIPRLDNKTYSNLLSLFSLQTVHVLDIAQVHLHIQNKHMNYWQLSLLMSYIHHCQLLYYVNMECQCTYDSFKFSWFLFKMYYSIPHLQCDWTLALSYTGHQVSYSALVLQYTVPPSMLNAFFSTLPEVILMKQQP